jgi:phthiocerol/phenolphthiocerol synthesis type-I polyketide synthase E
VSYGVRPSEYVRPVKAPAARTAEIEQILRSALAAAGGGNGLDIDADTNFSSIDENWKHVHVLRDIILPGLRERFGLAALYSAELRPYPTIRSLAAYLAAELESRFPVNGLSDLSDGLPWTWDELPPYEGTYGKNKPAIFLLGAGRSGTTLLRRMLNRHSGLAAPPELCLLPFENMGQRKREMLSHDQEWMRAGLLQTLIQLKRLSAEQSVALALELERKQVPVVLVYRMLQEAAGDRRLVDKSPIYLHRLDWLRRAEQLFDGPKYLFLTRHAFSVIESFVRMRFHRMAGKSWGTWDDNPWYGAEKTWTRCNSIAIRFLSEIPQNRKLFIRYEELVSDTTEALRRACDFLEIHFDPAMADPYRNAQFVSGIGDQNQIFRSQVESSLADAWKRWHPTWPLHAETRAVADHLGWLRTDCRSKKISPSRGPQHSAQLPRTPR